ncbi:MAG: NusG domain II-containing protein [Zetaproteobacteria bacterium]|nr:NusG domain II-containing protein [Zetaproteobacteria bacterium]
MTCIFQTLKGTWMDRLLLLLALVSVLGAWQWVQTSVAASTPMVHIYHGQTLLASYPLRSDKAVHYHAQGDVGGAEVVIAAGHVRIIHSTCTSKACVLSGEHEHLGDMIACVPNRILVLIEGEKSLQLDAVSQ